MSGEIWTIEHLRVAYQACFTAPAGALVLADLAEFCKDGSTTFDGPHRDYALINEGRRQVFLRIRDFFGLTVEELIALRAGRYSRVREGED